MENEIIERRIKQATSARQDISGDDAELLRDFGPLVNALTRWSSLSEYSKAVLRNAADRLEALTATPRPASLQEPEEKCSWDMGCLIAWGMAGTLCRHGFSSAEDSLKSQEPCDDCGVPDSPAHREAFHNLEALCRAQDIAHSYWLKTERHERGQWAMVGKKLQEAITDTDHYLQNLEKGKNKDGYG